MKFVKKKINNLLLSFFLVFLWSFSGLIIGLLMSKLFSPEIEFIDNSEELNNRLESNSILRIFGFDEVSNLSEKDIEIIGIVAGSDNGVILVSIKKGSVRALKAGEISQDGWIFKGISTETAIFLYKGQTIYVPFSVNKKNIFSNKQKTLKQTNDLDNRI